MITAVGSLVAASDKDPATATLTVTPARDVAVGALLVAWIAWDSVFSVFDPNDGEFAVYVDDSVGNHWCNIACGVDRQGFFATGCQGTLAVCQLRNALTTADSITVHGAFAGTLIAKAVSIEEFDLGSGMRWCRHGGAWTIVEDRGTDPSDVSVDAGVSQEWLILHCLANEGPSTDSFTDDSDYTPITAAGTTGGAADSNVTVRGGYRITTLQTDTVTTTNLTSVRDVIQVWAAICAVKPKPFSVTTIIDDANRADESPVDGGIWDTSGPTAFGASLGHLVSNKLAGGGGSFTLATYENCVDVFATYSVVGGTDQWANLHLFGAGNAATATMSGSGSAAWVTNLRGNTFDAIYFNRSSGNQGDPVSQELLAFIPASNGVKWGIQRTRGNAGVGGWVNHLWVDVGSGWQEVAALYVHGATATAGALAFGVNTSGASIDDFGGGKFPCGTRFLPQIYRRQFGVA